MARIKVGLRGSHPEIDAERRVIRVNINRCGLLQPFEDPCLRQGMFAKQFGESRAQFVCNLEDQRASETIFQIRSYKTSDMTEVVPDGAFKQEPPQQGKSPRREKLVKVDRAGRAAL